MGADNLLRSFHRWQNWRGISRLIPNGGRRPLGPSLLFGSRLHVAAQALAPSRKNRESEPTTTLVDRRPPAWVFLPRPEFASSSTRAGRAEGGHQSHKTLSKTRRKFRCRGADGGRVGPRRLAAAMPSGPEHEVAGGSLIFPLTVPHILVSAPQVPVRRTEGRTPCPAPASPGPPHVSRPPPLQGDNRYPRRPSPCPPPSPSTI